MSREYSIGKVGKNAKPSAFRSALMAKVRGKDTKPEKVVRSLAHKLGFRFRLHCKKLPGSPDLIFPKHRLAVFVHGCFWHRHPACSKTTTPKTRRRFWTDKFAANVIRDKKAVSALRKGGWRVLVIWECETRNSAKLSSKLKKVFRNPEGKRRPLSAQG